MWIRMRMCHFSFSFFFGCCYFFCQFFSIRFRVSHTIRVSSFFLVFPLLLFLLSSFCSIFILHFRLQLLRFEFAGHLCVWVCASEFGSSGNNAVHNNHPFTHTPRSWVVCEFFVTFIHISLLYSTFNLNCFHFGCFECRLFMFSWDEDKIDILFHLRHQKWPWNINIDQKKNDFFCRCHMTFLWALCLCTI